MVKKDKLGRFVKGQKPWNKNLTKEKDERIKRGGEKGSKTIRRLYKEGKLKHFTKFSLTKEQLYNLYWKRNLSGYQIGKKFGVCGITIYRWLKKYNIKRRTDSEAKKLNPSRYWLGKHRSEKTKRKIKDNSKINSNFGMRGKNHRKESKRKMGEAKLGDKNPTKRPEVRKKLSEINLGEKNPNYGKPRSLKSRKKTSASHQGISLKEWTHFTSFEPYSPEFNDRLKKYLRKKFNYICQLCGERITKQTPKKFLCIHHINYDKKDCREENLIPLCNFCNTSVNKDREDWNKFFQNKLNLNIEVTL